MEYQRLRLSKPRPCSCSSSPRVASSSSYVLVRVRLTDADGRLETSSSVSPCTRRIASASCFSFRRFDGERGAVSSSQRTASSSLLDLCAKTQGGMMTLRNQRVDETRRANRRPRRCEACRPGKQASKCTREFSSARESRRRRGRGCAMLRRRQARALRRDTTSPKTFATSRAHRRNLECCRGNRVSTILIPGSRINDTSARIVGHVDSYLPLRHRSHPRSHAELTIEHAALAHAPPPSSLYETPARESLATEAAAGRRVRVAHDPDAPDDHPARRRGGAPRGFLPRWVLLSHLERAWSRPRRPADADHASLDPSIDARHLPRSGCRPRVRPRGGSRAPYMWGGTVGPRFDCSGFAQAAYRRRGAWIPRDAHQQSAFVVASHHPREPGDLSSSHPSTAPSAVADFDPTDTHGSRTTPNTTPWTTWASSSRRRAPRRPTATNAPELRALFVRVHRSRWDRSRRVDRRRSIDRRGGRRSRRRGGRLAVAQFGRGRVGGGRTSGARRKSARMVGCGGRGGVDVWVWWCVVTAAWSAALRASVFASRALRPPLPPPPPASSARRSFSPLLPPEELVRERLEFTPHHPVHVARLHPVRTSFTILYG